MSGQHIYFGAISNTTDARDASTVNLKSLIPDWYDKVNIIMIQANGPYTYDNATGLLTVSDPNNNRTWSSYYIVGVM